MTEIQTPPAPTPAPTPPAPAPAPTPPAPTPPAPTPSAPQPPPPAGPVPQAPEQPLGEAGLRALQAERDARAVAERDAAAQKARADELARQSETEAQRLKREAEDGKALAAKGQESLRQANTLIGLSSLGLHGPKANAALRLLDGVVYDENSHQPTNLQERLEAAKAVYGAEIFAGATPVPTPTPAGGATPAPLPEVHQGPRLPAEPNEDQMFDAYMQRHFPGQVPQPASVPANGNG